MPATLKFLDIFHSDTTPLSFIRVRAGFALERANQVADIEAARKEVSGGAAAPGDAAASGGNTGDGEKKEDAATRLARLERELVELDRLFEMVCKEMGKRLEKDG